MKQLKWMVASLVFLVATGCSSSKITSSWKSETATPKKYEKVLVLGLIRDADRSLQENMEDHLVGDLKELGYNAVSSLREFGPKAFENMEEKEALNNIRNNGIDAVITVVLLDKEKERRYVPGNIYYSPYGYYYNRFWRYRATLYYRIYEPGYYVTDTKYFWESNLYEMNDQKLVYSVQTQSFDPENSEGMAHEYGRMILKNMLSEGVMENLKQPGKKAF